MCRYFGRKWLCFILCSNQAFVNILFSFIVIRFKRKNNTKHTRSSCPAEICKSVSCIDRMYRSFVPKTCDKIALCKRAYLCDMWLLHAVAGKLKSSNFLATAHATVACRTNKPVYTARFCRTSHVFVASCKRALKGNCHELRMHLSKFVCGNILGLLATFRPWNLLFCLELSLSPLKARHMRAVLPCIDAAESNTVESNLKSSGCLFQVNCSWQFPFKTSLSVFITPTFFYFFCKIPCFVLVFISWFCFSVYLMILF